MQNQQQDNTQLTFEKVWQMFQETDKQMKETDKKLNKLSEFYGGLSKNIGESVEDFFFYGFEQKPKIGNVQFKKVVQGMKTDDAEYDIVLTNGEYIAVIEAKHKFHPSDLDKFITKKLSVFKTEFPKFKDCKIIACIAGFVIPKETREKANELGVYIFTQSGDSIKSLNSIDFKFTEY